MTAEVISIERTLKSVKGLTDSYVDLTGGRIDQVNEALDHHIYVLKQIITLRLARIESVLIRPIALIYKNAEFHALRAYFHASPSLLAILSVIWAVVKIVYNIVQQIVSIMQILQEIGVYDLLASIWPAFKRARDKFRKWASELSETIGWGVDGLLHLLHATQGGTDVVAGIFGKSYSWMDAAWMSKTGGLLTNLSKYSHQITDDPGKILEILFQGEQRKSYAYTLKFGNELTNNLWNLAKKTTSALTGLKGVADELSAIQENMPEVVRANIPASVWSSLDDFSNIISVEILPRIRQVENTLTMIDSVFDAHSQRIGDLADKLAHPGTNLLGVDDLPDYAKDSELWAIDDVSSRLFGAGSEADRNDMQGDLDSFAIIDDAARSPLAVLPFMDIETPGRGALHGIVVEPQETWFVGGYGSQF